MRFAVFSDIHGNLPAFEAVWEDIRTRGIDKVFSLGDNIGYGPDSSEVTVRLAELGVPSVLGNHEHATLNAVARGWFAPSSLKALEITADGLTDEALELMRDMPDSRTFEDFRMVHGCPRRNLYMYLFAVDEERLARMFEQTPETVTFVGHTHMLETITYDGNKVERSELEPETAVSLVDGCRYIFNVGSVGQPRDDFSNKAKYVEVDTDAGTVTAHEIAYDFETVARRIREIGIPETFANRLLGVGKL